MICMVDVHNIIGNFAGAIIILAIIIAIVIISFFLPTSGLLEWIGGVLPMGR